MLKKVQFRSLLPRWRWPVLIILATLGVGGLIGFVRVKSLAEQLLPGILKAKLEAAIGHPVHFGRVNVWPTGIWVEQFRVLPVGNEKESLLTAKRLHVSADLWQMLLNRRVIVNGVDLDGAQVSFAPGPAKAAGKSWTVQLAGLSRSGLQRFGFRDTSLRILSAPAGKPAWTAERVNGDLYPQADGFRYRLKANQLQTGEVVLTGLRLNGSGDADGIQVADARADYQGGRLQANGTVRGAENAVAMTVDAKRVPLARLAAQIGIPAQWAVNGNVTGQITVNARSNALQAVRGAVTVDRGSFSRDGGRFPWRAATAYVDWSPERTFLRDIKVQGSDVVLTGKGTVNTPGGEPFTTGKFQVSGRLVAATGGAVVQISELLAFRKVLNGRWSARSAAVDFQAGGTVGSIAHASASGKLHVDELKFQPTPTSESVLISRLDADVVRTPDRLDLKNLAAQTDALQLGGDVTLTDARGGKPATFLADGRVDAADLKSLRKAVPEATLWKWIPVASPGANGTVTFKIGGPTDNPHQLWSQGSFELRRFRLGARSPLPNGATFFIPVEVARGTFAHQDSHLKVTDLAIDAQSFDAKGKLTLGFEKPEMAVAAELGIQTDDWRDLPAMPVGALPELQGGHLDGVLRVSGTYASITQAPVSGSFRLTGAKYASGRTGTEPIPLDELSANFTWANHVLDLPLVKVQSPVAVASARGQIYRNLAEYHIALDVNAQTPDAGKLALNVLPGLPVGKGQVTAKFHLDAPVEHPADIALNGSVDATDAKVSQAVPLLGLQSIDARTASADFTRAAGVWHLSRLDVDAPGLQLEAKGEAGDQLIDADVKLSADRWVVPEKVPVAGGVLALSGHVLGNPARPQTLAFSGEIKVDGAQPRYKTQQAALEGGKLALVARGEGQLADPLQWLRSGDVNLKNAKAELPGRPAMDVDAVTASFRREGDKFLWKDANLLAAGVSASSSGEWTHDRHEITLTGTAKSLAQLGLTLPEGVGADRYWVTATVIGSDEQPLREVRGKLELDKVKVALAGAPEQAFDRVGGDFRVTGDRIYVSKLEGTGAAGTVTVSGDWGKSGGHVDVVAAGEEFGKLGIALPEGFSVKGYRVEGGFRSEDGKHLANGTGTIRLTGAQVPLGTAAPQRIDTAFARFAVEKDRTVLSDLSATGPAGTLTGKGELSSRGYRLALSSPQLDPTLVAWMIPGKVEGGRLSGTLVVVGEKKQPVRSAEGHFSAYDATYSIPETLALNGTPIHVASIAGDYRWDGTRTVLSKLKLDADVVNGTGTLTVADGAGTIHADVSTHNSGKVADFWPVLTGRLHDGEATGVLNASFDPKGVSGTLKLSGRGGILMLKEAPADFAEEPIDTATGLLTFEPGLLTFDDVKVRGPKGNLDGAGYWTDNGPVNGTGKAWFSKSFTAKLIKPTGFGWLAKLFGLREIKSDWKIGGTSERVTLNAGITRSFMWKFAKGQVPKEFQQIAQGKAPLYIKPLDVTAAAVPPVAPEQKPAAQP